MLGGGLAGCVMEPLADYRVHAASLSADRYRSLWARVKLLDRAEANHRLTSSQCRALGEARAIYRRRALSARADQALMDRSPGRRRACLDLLRVPGGTSRERAYILAALVAPGLAGHRLRQQALRRGKTRADRSMPS